MFSTPLRDTSEDDTATFLELKPGQKRGVTYRAIPPTPRGGGGQAQTKGGVLLALAAFVFIIIIAYG
jgi:hypothetical protein